MDAPGVARTLYVVRHGEKERDDGLDPNLTTLGTQQAESTGRFMKDKKIDLMVVSPFRRTLQTALQMNKNLRADKLIVLDWGVSEWLDSANWGEGPCPALDDLAATRAERDSLIAQLKISSSAAQYTMHTTEPCPTETRDQLLARAASVLDHIHAALPKGGSVLIVTHAATHEALVRSLCPGHKPFFPDPCSISVVTRKPDAQNWSVELLASTTHLAYLARQQGPVFRPKK